MGQASHGYQMRVGRNVIILKHVVYYNEQFMKGEPARKKSHNYNHITISLLIFPTCNAFEMLNDHDFVIIDNLYNLT